MNRYKHRKKAKMNAIVMIKKKITQKTGLRRKWIGRGVAYKKEELTENRKTEGVQTRSRRSIEKNGKRIEQRMKEREKR